MRRIGPLLSARLRPAPRAAWDYPAPRAACGFSVDASKAAPAHTPPLVVRASLVCGATALATPLFPIIGLNQLCFRYLDVQTRMVLTGGSSLAYFSAAVLAPEAFRYAPLLLPFAVGNGLTAAALYTAADVFAGGPDALAGLRIGPLPAAGALLGAATALIVPWTYPACWAWCIEGVATMGDADLYRAIHTLCYDRAGGAAVALPCLFVTGGVRRLLGFPCRRVSQYRDRWPALHCTRCLSRASSACPESRGKRSPAPSSPRAHWGSTPSTRRASAAASSTSPKSTKPHAPRRPGTGYCAEGRRATLPASRRLCGRRP
ncbi:hypothetical protein M885DRAFT_190740 [Pelagophyceae sp. CCMP2097]|nr:hypothetical protein M885DRAFT_190740 [Pelagophyceae sp. CCMP2097]